MLCKKTCPVCEETLNKHNVLRSAYKWEYQTITCKNCSSKLKPNWGSAIAWMSLCILPIGPLFNIFDISNYIGIALLIITASFIVLPLSVMVGLCKIKIEVENE